MSKPNVEQLRNALSDIAWDCSSGWLDVNGLESWSDGKVRRVSQNIVNILTKGVII